MAFFMQKHPKSSQFDEMDFIVLTENVVLKQSYKSMFFSSEIALVLQCCICMLVVPMSSTSLASVES